MAFLNPVAALVARFTSSPSQVRKRARWSTNGRPEPVQGRQSGPYKIGIPDDLTHRVQQLMNAAAPSLARAYDTHLQPVAERAFNQWPVRTGFSKSTLSLDYFVENAGRTYRAQIVVRAPYAGFIREKGSKTRVARKLLFRPLEAAVALIARDAIDDIAGEVR